MGQNSSAPQKEVSLYEILAVDPSVDEAGLKRAYKKLALALHPDRNYDNVEEATTKFAKVQAAYDILSDPHERAWYDSHGDSGPQGSRNGGRETEYGGNITKTDELKSYLDPEWYQKFVGEDETFYEAIQQLFMRLAREENEAAHDQGEEDLIYPTFGHANTAWRDVRSFYEFWQSFSSVKEFSWEDVYRSWDAGDRRTRRAMEARNNKIRDAARNEFNKTVRLLVKCIKTRDTRYKQNRKKQNGQPEDANAKAQAKRDRKKNREQQMDYEEQEWEKVRPQDVFEDEEASGGSNEEEAEQLEIECVVCDKMFKSEQQFKVHEQSRKHLRTLKDLQRQMRKEGIDLGIDESDADANEGSQQSETTSRAESPSSLSRKPQVQEQSGDIVNEETGTNDEQSTSTKKQEKQDSQAEADGQADGEASVDDLLAQLEGLKADKKKGGSDSNTGGGKAKNRRRKKDQQNDLANRCAVCQTDFPSRNKLFDHIKASGHVGLKHR